MLAEINVNRHKQQDFNNFNNLILPTTQNGILCISGYSLLLQKLLEY